MHASAGVVARVVGVSRVRGPEVTSAWTGGAATVLVVPVVLGAGAGHVTVLSADSTSVRVLLAVVRGSRLGVEEVLDGVELAGGAVSLASWRYLRSKMAASANLGV